MPPRSGNLATPRPPPLTAPQDYPPGGNCPPPSGWVFFFFVGPPRFSPPPSKVPRTRGPPPLLPAPRTAGTARRQGFMKAPSPGKPLPAPRPFFFSPPCFFPFAPRAPARPTWGFVFVVFCCFFFFSDNEEKKKNARPPPPPCPHQKLGPGRPVPPSTHPRIPPFPPGQHFFSRDPCPPRPVSISPPPRPPPFFSPPRISFRAPRGFARPTFHQPLPSNAPPESPKKATPTPQLPPFSAPPRHRFFPNGGPPSPPAHEKPGPPFLNFLLKSPEKPPFAPDKKTPNQPLWCVFNHKTGDLPPLPYSSPLPPQTHPSVCFLFFFFFFFFFFFSLFFFWWARWFFFLSTPSA